MADFEEQKENRPSWASRLGSSFKGVLAGLVLFIAGFPILFWNEGRAVDTAKRLAEGAGAVIDVPVDKIDSANEGKLVHVSGKADVRGVVTDDLFGLSAPALRLQRTVEVYQMVEHRETKKVEEGNKTREVPYYTYSMEWCDKPVSSAGFNQEDKRNSNPPAAMPFGKAERVATNATLGAFRLSEKHVKRISGWKPFQFPPDFKVPSTVKGAQLYNGVVYVPFDAVAAQTASGSPLAAAAQALASKIAGADRSVAVYPKSGDVRVTFRVVEPHEVTIVERQVGDTLAPWTASDGEALSFVEEGLVDAKKIFSDAKSSNKTVTWLLRIVGLLVMYFGLKKVLDPIDTLVDMIPILNGIVAAGTALIAGLISGACALVTIGIAWIFYRPLIGILLLAIGIALAVMAFMKKQKAAKPIVP